MTTIEHLANILGVEMSDELRAENRIRTWSDMRPAGIHFRVLHDGSVNINADVTAGLARKIASLIASEVPQPS
jgi:hypothetical protein